MDQNLTLVATDIETAIKAAAQHGNLVSFAADAAPYIEQIQPQGLMSAAAPSAAAATTSAGQVIVQDIKQALSVAQTQLPTLLAMIAPFYPPAAMILKFLPAITPTIAAIDIVAQDLGLEPSESASTAVAQVVSTVTPGMPSASSLSESAGPPDLTAPTA